MQLTFSITCRGLLLLAGAATVKAAEKCENRRGCSGNGVCFLGECFCYPAYRGGKCEERFEPANPWYTTDCPNLLGQRTFHRNATGAQLSSGRGCNPPGTTPSKIKDLSYCAYLCYSHPEHGVALIPTYIWHAAQVEESIIWQGNSGHNDRAGEHLEGFKNYIGLPPNSSLGHMAEFGAGPWTQTRTLLAKRPDIKIDSFTVQEPGADFYIRNTPNCAYKTGRLERWGGVHHAS